MGLKHVVITSVDRDDLPNGGAEAFAGCVTEIRASDGRSAAHGERPPRGEGGAENGDEVLIPDFKGSERRSGSSWRPSPHILNHNLETCERLYRLARPGGRYDRALALLANARAGSARTASPSPGSSSAWARSGTRS
jgi:lipoic acid synthetase